jgi:hypothetical protein
MELITVNSEVFKRIDKNISLLAEYILWMMKKPEVDGLVDNSEICIYLKINTKTLHRLRTKGVVNFITAERKHLYKLSEVRRLLEENLIRSNPENFTDLLHNHEAYLRNRILSKSKKKENNK